MVLGVTNVRTNVRKLLSLVAHLGSVPLCAVRLLAGAGRHAMKDETVLLYLSEVMWDEVWQRPQELATRLSRHLPVIYCSPVQLHRRLFSLGNRWSSLRISHDEETKLHVLSPLVFPGHYRSPHIYAWNCHLLSWVLAQWLSRTKLVLCLTDSPFAWPIISRLFYPNGQRDSRLVRLHYDIIDDFPAFPWAPPIAREYDNALLEHADSVTTGTYELWNQHRGRRPDAEFIQCGVDFDAFNRAAGPPPSDVIRLPEPRLGYIGSVSDRLDFDLIRKLAERFSHGSVILVGPIRMREEDLPRAHNIHYLGLKPHAELPRYAQSFTVGLIPFLVNEATVKLNPVKTLEYLAAGIPVVSTALPDVMRFFSTAVDVARSHEEFLQRIEQLVEYPDVNKIRCGVDLARSSSWEAMAQRMASRLLAPASRQGDVVDVPGGNR